MKKVGDLMRELGFREDASEGAKEAFLKHLMKTTTGKEIETPTERRKRQQKDWTKVQEIPEAIQLSFDFGTVKDPQKAG